MARPTYALAVDWSQNGVWTNTGESVISRTLTRDRITCSYGRDTARALSPLANGEASFTLNNTSRDYSPMNTSSPITSVLGPGRPVRWQATHLATTYTLFLGQLDDYIVNARRGERVARMTLVDGLARLRDATVSTELHDAVRTGEAIDLLLDAAGWTAGRDIDPGATVIRWWWVDGQDAWSALEDLVASEGSPAIAYIGTDGSFVFRDRHHRLTRSASTTSQATFRGDTGAEPKFSDIAYEIGWREIVNSVTFSVPERQPSLAKEVVWSYDGTISIPAAGSETITVQASDPFYDAVTPADGTDFGTRYGTATASLSRTSGQSLELTISAGVSGAAVNNLQLRATSVKVARTTQVSYESSSSVTSFGRRSGSVDAPWAGRWDAGAIARLIVNKRGDRVAAATITLLSKDDTRLTQQLNRDIGDRVTIVEPELGLSNAFHIERIEHDANEALLETRFGCEQVGTTLDAAATIFVLDTSVLNTGQLAY